MTSETIKCIGCGAYLQSQTPNRAGYCPSASLKAALKGEEVYCKRCFRLRHYNELLPVAMSEDDFLAILQDIGGKDALVVFVVDIFDLAGSLLSSMGRLIGGLPFILAVNKCELLPKEVKKSKIQAYIESYSREQGLRPEAVALFSAKKGLGLTNLAQLIEEKRHGLDVYIVGATNVGKSTLINAFLKQAGLGEAIITASHFPATTLDVVEITLDDQALMVDTPGIFKAGSMLLVVDTKDVGKLQAKRPLKPKTYQLDAGQTIFIDGLAQVSYLKGERNSFTFYISEQLHLHRRKIEGAAAFLAEHAGDLLPIQAKSPEFERHTVKLNGDMDIAIAGLGWLSVKQPAVVEIALPKGVSFAIRTRMI